MDAFWASFGEGHPMPPTSALPDCGNNFTPGMHIDVGDGNSPQAAPLDSPTVMAARRPTTKLARRDKNFTHREDELICAAYANVSKDPITGINQMSGGYWKRFYEFFHAHKDFESARTQTAIQKRWQTIQKETTKFCGYKEKIDRRNESGKGEQDRVNDALKLFNDLEGHPFNFLHCWMILKNERKWCEHVLSISEPNHQPSMGTSSQSQSAGSTEPLDLDSAGDGSAGGSRPIGRDAAKRRRARLSMASSSSSSCVEVLERMATNREQVELKRADYIVELLAREDRKLQLKERELCVREREMAARERAEETRIMSVDVSKIPEWQREYYIVQQQEIVNKHRRTRAGENEKEQ